MKMLTYLAVALFVCSAAADNFKPRQAIAHIVSPDGVIKGNITFRQISDKEVEVLGTIIGVKPGTYGFHIHEKGDLSNGCASLGAHFNPQHKDHGAPDALERHVGDLGNVIVGDDQTAHIKITDSYLALDGKNNILGRGVVIHEGIDDLGLGKHPDSLTTGNAGGRAACGVIGILDPIEPWSGASGTTASMIIIFASTIIALF